MPRKMLKQVLRPCLFVVCLPANTASRIFDRFYYDADFGGVREGRQSRDEEALLDSQFEKNDVPQNSSPIRESLLDIIQPIYFLKFWNHETQKLRPTAWLDGVRGVAALIVTIYHFAHFWPWMVRGWGASETDYHWLQFYFVRLIISGGFMVRIFFVISGYVLSSKLGRLARDRQYNKLFQSLSSSGFRRWVRLMLPSVASMVLEWFMLVIFSPEYRAKKTFMMHLAAICGDVWGLTNAFQIGKYRPEFNKVLWTIPAEFKGSLIVYFLVLSLARTRAQAKIPILFGAMAQCTFTSDHLLALFIAGLIMAEFDLLWKTQATEEPQTWSQLLRTVQPYTLVLGLYLGSRPDGMDRAPGYINISYILVKYFFVRPSQLSDLCPAIGGILVVSSINYSPLLQRPFITCFAQYLGDISFSIYLIHFFILNNICKPWMPTAVALFDFLGPEHTSLSYGCGAALNMAIVGPLTFWTSDLFTRFVDVKAVKLAKDLEIWAMVESEKLNEDVKVRELLSSQATGGL